MCKHTHRHQVNSPDNADAVQTHLTTYLTFFSYMRGNRTLQSYHDSQGGGVTTYTAFGQSNGTENVALDKAILIYSSKLYETITLFY